jgi:hypothetical protein
MKLVVLSENGYRLIRRGLGGLSVGNEELADALGRVERGQIVNMGGSLPGVHWVWLPRGIYTIQRAENPFLAGGTAFVVLKGSRVGAAEVAIRNDIKQVALVDTKQEAERILGDAVRKREFHPKLIRAIDGASIQQ